MTANVSARSVSWPARATTSSSPTRRSGPSARRREHGTSGASRSVERDAGAGQRRSVESVDAEALATAKRRVSEVVWCDGGEHREPDVALGSDVIESDHVT